MISVSVVSFGYDGLEGILDSLNRTPFFKCKVCYPFQFFVFSLDCFSHPSAKAFIEAVSSKRGCTWACIFSSYPTHIVFPDSEAEPTISTFVVKKVMFFNFASFPAITSCVKSAKCEAEVEVSPCSQKKTLFIFP